MGLVKNSDENSTYIQIAYLRKKFKMLPFIYRNVCDFIIDSAPDDVITTNRKESK